MKFSIKKLEKATLVGVASLALIIPLGMSGNSSAHIVSANGADVYGDQADQMIDNGLINTQGQWTASKHDHWLFNKGLMDSTGELDAAGNEVEDLATLYHMSFMRAYHFFEKEGEPDEGQLVSEYLKLHPSLQYHPRHHVSKRNHHAKRTRKARMNKRSRKRNKSTKRRNRKHSKRARKPNKRNRRNRKARKHTRRY